VIKAHSNIMSFFRNMIDCNRLTIAQTRDLRLDGDVKIVAGPSRYGQHSAYGIKQSFTVYPPWEKGNFSLRFGGAKYIIIECL